MDGFNGKTGVEMHFYEGLSNGGIERESAVFYLVLDPLDPKDEEILTALKQVPEIYDHLEPSHYDWEEAYNRAVLFFNLVKGLLKSGELPRDLYEFYKPLFWAMENVDTDPFAMKVLSPKKARMIILTGQPVY